VAAGRVIIFTNLRASVARIMRRLQSHSALFQAREFVGQGQGSKKKGQVGRAGLGTPLMAPASVYPTIITMQLINHRLCYAAKARHCSMSTACL
jgi:hypothetical protein